MGRKRANDIGSRRVLLKQADNSVSTISPLLETSPTPATSASYIASTVAAAASVSTQAFSTSNASVRDVCGQIGGTCSGDITVYDTAAGLTPEIFVKRGFGSCGWLSNGTYENVFALAHGESPIQQPSSLHHPSHLLCRHDGRPVERKPLLRPPGHHHTLWQDCRRQARRQMPRVRWPIHRSLRSSFCCCMLSGASGHRSACMSKFVGMN